MTVRQGWLSLVRQQRAIAVIRAPQHQVGWHMARAVAAGGLNLIEITWNSHEAARLISQLRSELPHCTIGTGTLLTCDDVQQAIAAGAQFLFTPHVNPAMLQTALAAQTAMIPGALTPTEIVTAWQAGAASVKVFPIHAVGGAAYIRSLQGPLGHIPLIPTGGVTLENASSLLSAGAIAVGLSGQLFPAEAIAAGHWEQVTERTRCLRQVLSNLPQSTAPNLSEPTSEAIPPRS